MITRHSRSRTAGYIAAVATMVLATGCGSDEAATDASPPATTLPAPSTETELPSDGITRLYVKPERVDCTGEAPQQCLQVAESEDGPYEFFYDSIEGFEFEEGTTYVLDVEVSEGGAAGSALGCCAFGAHSGRTDRT